MSRPRPVRRPLRRVVGTAVVTGVVIGALAGCSAQADDAADPTPADAASAPTSDPTSDPAIDPASDPASAGAPDTPDEPDEPDDPASDPVTSPYVVAAVAAARRSVDQVQQLHAVWVSTVDDTGIPRAQRPALARTIRASFVELVLVDTRLPPPAGTPAARLAAVLGSYQRLAGQLVAGDGARVPAGFAREIARTDRRWRAVLGDLGELAGEDLVGDLPTLLAPRGR